MVRWECRDAQGAPHGAVRVVLPLGEVLLEASVDARGRLDGPARYRAAYQHIYEGLPEALAPEAAALALPGCDRVDATFRTGVPSGPLRCYRRGVLLISGQLVAGRPDGEWRFADATGALVGRNVVHAGTGSWVHWDAEGRVVWSGRLRGTRWEALVARVTRAAQGSR